MSTAAFDLFDAHLHIVDPRFPLIRNAGYLPEPFTADDYLSRMEPYRLVGGAVVSGSFQGFDQGYLVAALQRLGPGFVGVTQLPAMTPDSMLLDLDAAGVRALRFNVKRGGSEDLKHLDRMARRVHELVGWHVELYADAAEIAGLRDIVAALPSVSIDHLGLSRAGLATLLWLIERGVRVKATGFGRLDFPVRPALRALYEANPDALMFGTDLPSTRAPRAYIDDDFPLVVDTLGEDAARQVFHDNARAFYRIAAYEETQS